MALIGVWTNSSYNPLTYEQQQNNAYYIWQYFQARGWTMESVSAMLGNIQFESYINPAQWQAGHTIEDPNYPNDTGFGLVQWTPWQKYAEWAGSDYRTNYQKQLARIQYELENGLQWITQYGNMSFYDFTQSTASVSYLARVFEYNYERGTWSDYRSQYAENWYTYLSGSPQPPAPGGGNIPRWLLFKIKGLI